MKNRMGIIVLILICVVLGVVVIWTQKQSAEQRSSDAERIGNYSNRVVKAGQDLDQERQARTALEGDFAKQREAYTNLSKSLTQVSNKLQKTEGDLKAAEVQVAQRDAKISDLEAQNQALDQRALDLSTSITNLTSQIDDTRKKLSASEGDKAFLERELQRLMAEKAELEKQFNDLAVLRAQVAKLKEELNISRRLDWIRRGLFASTEQKGAEQLMRPVTPREPAKQPSYDLNVEVSADGTVRVIPPLTNNPSGAAPK